MWLTSLWPRNVALQYDDAFLVFAIGQFNSERLLLLSTTAPYSDRHTDFAAHDFPILALDWTGGGRLSQKMFNGGVS